MSAQKTGKGWAEMHAPVYEIETVRTIYSCYLNNYQENVSLVPSFLLFGYTLLPPSSPFKKFSVGAQDENDRLQNETTVSASNVLINWVTNWLNSG